MFKKIFFILVVIFFSALLTLFTLETAYKYYKIVINKNNYEKNKYLFYKNLNNKKVFENYKNFFTYNPNSKIRAVNFFYKKKNWIKEYDYTFETNNFGLAQSKNINKDLDSILLLGDSFTEGQGSYPWINKFNNENISQKFQIINGGILGTGPQQFLNLHNFLKKKNLKINKVYVLFVWHDFFRSPWTPTYYNAENCLINPDNCYGGEPYFGIPNDNKFEKILNLRRGHRTGIWPSKNVSMKAKIKFYFPLSISFLQNILSKNTIAKNRAFKLNFEDGVFFKNLDAILKLSEIYKNDLVLIHLPQKQEVFENSLNKKSKSISNFFLKKEFNYINGLEKCKFLKKDFYRFDGHLNSKGYQKLFNCTLNLLEKNSF
jgi:hypothetical protein